MEYPTVVLYHREPYDEIVTDGVTRYVEKKKPNGIVPSLKSVFCRTDNGLWISWKTVSDPHAPFQQTVKVEGFPEGSEVYRIPLTEEQVSNFYHITAKEAFWPILHSFPLNFRFDTSDWENFVDINRTFADVACKRGPEEAIFWVHDYNLWLTPYFIREKRPDAKIAFFLHTPFPSADIFNILPWRDAIIDSLLACDLCAFHIPRYVENFADIARNLRGAKTLEKVEVPKYFVTRGTALAEKEMTTTLSYQGRSVSLQAVPVGTNPELIRSIIADPTTERRVASIREELGDKKLIVSAGRVDYTKGTKELLLSYERLLDKRPDLHGAVVLVCTSVPAASGMRAYDEIQKELEHIAGRLNARYRTLDWNPLIFFTQASPFNELVAYMRAADIGWITPLRDGLNLVAKEFVIAQEGLDGVLLLSEFTGASIEIDGALLVNPYSSDSMDAGIERALEMSSEERRSRLERMLTSVTRLDVHDWGSHVYSAAQKAEAPGFIGKPGTFIPDVTMIGKPPMM